MEDSKQIVWFIVFTNLGIIRKLYIHMDVTLKKNEYMIGRNVVSVVKIELVNNLIPKSYCTLL